MNTPHYMAKKLSIRDIAEELDISKTTISFILNGKAKEKRISDNLVEKVLKYVEERNYKPSQLAKSLSTGKSMIIALMVEKISDHFFAQMAYHIEELAYKSDYKIIYCSTDNDAQKTRELIKLFRERHVDGYIITPPAGIEEDIRALIADGLPVVLFDRYFADIETNYVVLDNYHASKQASNYLIEKQYKHIALVLLDSEQTQMRDRQAGYEDAMREIGLPSLIKRIAFNSSPERTVKDLMHFIRQHPLVDAIFFATNYLTFSGIKALNELKIKVPQDIAIVAFDDHHVFSVYSPTVTAVAQPIDQLAKESIGILLDELGSTDPGRAVGKIVVSAELIERESTRRGGGAEYIPVSSQA